MALPEPDFCARRVQQARIPDTAAGSLQDWYAAHTPLIALYWDSQLLAHSAAYENFTVDAVFGLNNANTRFTITEK